MKCLHELRTLCIMEWVRPFNHRSSMLSGDFANKKSEEKIMNSFSSFVFYAFLFLSFSFLCASCIGFLVSSAVSAESRTTWTDVQEKLKQ